MGTTTTRKPWERRLEDLAHLLSACSTTYFDPELFRRNTNQFLQTARTITFIIQKNKAFIPSFDSWYRANVLDAWSQDKVMTWAKDARNTIEKEGDLEINSFLNLVLIFSYLEEQDLTIPCGSHELLEGGVKQLIAFAKKYLPLGIADAAAIRIERSWITSGLDSWELMNALSYVYARIFDCCTSLAVHLEISMPLSVPEPSVFSDVRHEAKEVQFVKLSNLKAYRIKAEKTEASNPIEIPDDVRVHVNQLAKQLRKPFDFGSAATYYQDIAQDTFLKWGNHVQMIFLLNKDWSVQYFAVPHLADQADKFFFWRFIGERVRIQQPHALVHTCEVWIRDRSKLNPSLAIRGLPIKGECLQTCIFDAEGNSAFTMWTIHRSGESDIPSLGPSLRDPDADKRAFFLVPPMRGMGLNPDVSPINATNSS